MLCRLVLIDAGLGSMNSTEAIKKGIKNGINKVEYIFLLDRLDGAGIIYQQN